MDYRTKCYSVSLQDTVDPANDPATRDDKRLNLGRFDVAKLRTREALDGGIYWTEDTVFSKGKIHD